MSFVLKSTIAITVDIVTVVGCLIFPPKIFTEEEEEEEEVVAMNLA